MSTKKPLDNKQLEFVMLVNKTIDKTKYGISSGVCCSCGECQHQYDMSEPQIADAQDKGAIVEEGSFSWANCDCCKRDIAGDRHTAHALLQDTTTIEGIKKLSYFNEHLEICSDCLEYIANDTIPEFNI